MIRIMLTILLVIMGLTVGNASKANTSIKQTSFKTFKADTNKVNKSKTGKATWYGGNFHGGLTANGETYDMYSMTCATRNRTIPFNTRIEVTCLDTGKKVIVRVNNRMAKNVSRNLDLSVKAFKKIAPLNKGVLTIKYRILN